MNRLPRFACLLFPLFLPAASARAEDPAAPPKPEPPAHAPRFFVHPLDYWETTPQPSRARAAIAEKTASDSAGSSREGGASPWSRRVQMSDGTYRTEDLPPLLVQVLEDPTPENIRAYFEWRADRTRKILRAAQKIGEYRATLVSPAEHRGEPAGENPPEPTGPLAAPLSSGPLRESIGASPPLPSLQLLYFHRSGCSHCDTQEAILAGWLKDKPQVTLQAIEFGDHPELWKAYRVRGTPSIVLVDSSSGESRFLEGVASQVDLDRSRAALVGPRKPLEGSRGERTP